MISVVIPCYKARNFLAQALNSVATQTLQPSEVLLIDDFSPEPIDDIGAEFQVRPRMPQIRIVRHEKNGGLGAARNTGIREAKGEWIAFLDHDDLWAPEHLASLVGAQNREEVDLAFSTVKQFREKIDDSLGQWGPGLHGLEKNLPLALFEQSFITPSASLIRRESLLDVGCFDTDPRVHMCEDLDLWLRLLQRGARFSHVADPTCYYRKHDGAATSRIGYMAYQSAWVREKHFANVDGPWFRKRSIVAFRWWQAWVDFLAAGKPRWDVLVRAIWWGLPVPWEIGRGVVRSFRKLRP
jgi:glycosyltransferase involved in cell wall biosynthesis